MTIHPFKMTGEVAINYIRQVAKEGNISLLDVGDGEPFKKIATLRQVFTAGIKMP